MNVIERRRLKAAEEFERYTAELAGGLFGAGEVHAGEVEAERRSYPENIRPKTAEGYLKAVGVRKYAQLCRDGVRRMHDASGMARFESDSRISGNWCEKEVGVCAKHVGEQ